MNKNNKIIKKGNKNKSIFLIILSKINKKILTTSLCFFIGIVTTVVVIISVNIVQNKKQENKMCSVQFNTNGAPAIKDVNLKCGETIKKLPSPKKNGFEFIGWYLNDKEYDFLSQVDKNIILEARWEVKQGVETVIVSFDTGGGSEIEPIELEKGEILVKPINPTLSGHEFSGWYYNYEKFDFSDPIYENITLKAKWEEKNNNNNIQPQISTSSSKYKCSGSFRSDVPVKNVTIGYSDHVNWTWSTHGAYGGETTDVCYVTYKTSDASIATVNQNGIITTKNAGTVYISECVNDTETKKELICFKGELNVVEKKCKYQTDPLTYKMNNQTWDLNIGTNIDFPLKTYFSYEVDGCTIQYKSSNDSIASVSNSGLVIPKSTGTATITSCIVNSANEKELDCISFKAKVKDPYISEYSDENLFKNLQGTWYVSDYGKEAYVKFTQGTRNGEKVLYYEEYNFCSSTGQIYPSTCWGTGYFSYDMLTSPGIGINEYGWSYNNGYLYNSSGNAKIKFLKNPTYASVSSVDLNINVANLNVGDNVSLIANIKPSNAGNKNITWTSGDSSVAKVNSSGIVTAVSKGTTTIIATTEDGGYTAECVITVNTIKVNSISLNSTSMSLVRGSSGTLAVNISPNNATNKNITWTSSDSSVAKVNSSGVVTAVSKGATTITATTEDGGYIAKCVVTVSNPTLIVRGSIGIQTIVSSSGATRGIHAVITASGGTGTYTYYYIKIYKDGTLIGNTTNTSSNELFISGHTNGSYTIEYEVRDSDGTTKTGTSSSTISGF